MRQAEPLRADFDFRRIQRLALIAGVAGLAVCALGAFLSTQQFFFSYLWAYLFWLGIALGSFGFMMLQHMVGGRWAVVIRRVLETGSLTIPVMALLFVPLVFGLPYIYEWADPAHVQGDPILEAKQPYLNIPFFIIRAIFYFAVWIGLAFALNRWSREQDRSGSPVATRRLRVVSGPGLILYMLTMTFAAFDWGMSLDPHWYSTIYGALFVISQGLTTLAFVIIVMRFLVERKPLSTVVTAAHFHDLGNLLLAFTMLWAYMSLSQFLIIWSGNLPEEVVWYLDRTAGTWVILPIFLAVFQFVLPFFLLLARANKRRAQALARVATLIILVQLVYLFWLVVPTFHEEGVFLHWLDLAAPIGIGGIWIAAFVWLLPRRPLLPLHDPRWEDFEEQHH
jgi:hypothetical protein